MDLLSQVFVQLLHALLLLDVLITFFANILKFLFLSFRVVLELLQKLSDLKLGEAGLRLSKAPLFIVNFQKLSEFVFTLLVGFLFVYFYC